MAKYFITEHSYGYEVASYDKWGIYFNFIKKSFINNWDCDITEFITECHTNSARNAIRQVKLVDKDAEFIKNNFK